MGGQVTKIVEKMFTGGELGCPVCGQSLVTPVQEYCDHIAFYCVHGPVDDPVIEYQADEIELDLDKISSDKNWLEVGSNYALSIYKYIEQDAYYPTTVILGVNPDETLEEGNTNAKN